MRKARGMPPSPVTGNIPVSSGSLTRHYEVSGPHGDAAAPNSLLVFALKGKFFDQTPKFASAENLSFPVFCSKSAKFSPYQLKSSFSISLTFKPYIFGSRGRSFSNRLSSRRFLLLDFITQILARPCVDPVVMTLKLFLTFFAQSKLGSRALKNCQHIDICLNR